MRSSLLSRPQLIRTSSAGTPAAASSLVVHLAVGAGRRVQAAGAGIGHVGLDGGKLQLPS